MTIWLAQDLTAGRQQPMDDERIECKWFTPAEVARMIERKEIADAKTLIGWSQWKINGKKFRGSK
jgi:hypothetical protein